MYTEEMRTAIRQAQHILESAGLTTEGFDDEFGVDGEIIVCISNQLEMSGDTPPTPTKNGTVADQ